jgi:serine/threonine-protein kinase
MAVIRLQNESEKNVYYEYDSSEKPLGEGGMGRVFRGKRIETNRQGIVLKERDVAIKCMFEGLPEHIIMRARREASIRIKSLNLIEMIDFVEIHKGQNIYYHVVSELLDGVNLDELLEGRVDNHNGTPNPAAKKLFNQYQQNRKAFVGTVFRGLLSGISVLHDQGYIHRDIDPSNIMITSSGDVKLIDFGIAKKIDDLATTDKQLTSDGQFAGKVCYASPELVLGDLKHQSNTTDIYALGITLFQLVTGHLPFEGSFAEVYKKQLNDKLPLKEIGDKVLRSIIEKATDKDQNKRYQSAAEFRVAIDEWMASNGGHDDDKKKKIIVSVAAALIAILACLFVWWILNHDGRGEIVTPEEIVDSPELPKQDPIICYTHGKRYVYEGDLDSLGRPNGQGKAVFDSVNYGQRTALFDSCVYVGSFYDGDLEGDGTMIYYGGEWEGRVNKGRFKGSAIDTGTMTSPMYYFVGKFKDDDCYNGFLYLLPDPSGLDSTRRDSIKSEIKNGK